MSRKFINKFRKGKPFMIMALILTVTFSLVNTLISRRPCECEPKHIVAENHEPKSINVLVDHPSREQTVNSNVTLPNNTMAGNGEQKSLNIPVNDPSTKQKVNNNFTVPNNTLAGNGEQKSLNIPVNDPSTKQKVNNNFTLPNNTLAGNGEQKSLNIPVNDPSTKQKVNNNFTVPNNTLAGNGEQKSLNIPVNDPSTKQKVNNNFTVPNNTLAGNGEQKSLNIPVNDPSTKQKVNNNFTVPNNTLAGNGEQKSLNIPVNDPSTKQKVNNNFTLPNNTLAGNGEQKSLNIPVNDPSTKQKVNNNFTVPNNTMAGNGEQKSLNIPVNDPSTKQKVNNNFTLPNTTLAGNGEQKSLNIPVNDPSTKQKLNNNFTLPNNTLAGNGEQKSLNIPVNDPSTKQKVNNNFTVPNNTMAGNGEQKSLNIPVNDPSTKQKVNNNFTLPNNTLAGTGEQKSLNIPVNDPSTKQKVNSKVTLPNNTMAGNPKQEPLKGQTDNPSIEQIVKTKVAKYNLGNDKLYHYEFRFELSTNNTNDDQRLMILLHGRGRVCIDWWEFPVGRRILSTIRTAGYSILAICSAEKTFDVNVPIQNNTGVKWMYLSLQKWMNEVYYKQFQRYPRLYIHGISQGSTFASLLCRVLPIQGQILSIYPGHREAMLTRSDYRLDMRTRLLLDPVFANWFYFDFCYNAKLKNGKNHDLCPFENDRPHFRSVSPTYFIHLMNDPWHTETEYRKIILDIRKDAFRHGETLLHHPKSMKLVVLHPINTTSSYMQENFDIWRSKPHASQIFFEHFHKPKLYKVQKKEQQTCWCSEIDFKYFERFPNITKTWLKKKQEEYSDYVRDIHKFYIYFCEELCGDLTTYHAMSSRDIPKALDWVKEIDHLQHSFQVENYLKRPLRIWMYEKDSLIRNASSFSSHEANWVGISKAYQMYSPEYLLQDYFQRLNASNTLSRHNLQWTVDPLLADYFIIPSDLMFFYFNHHPENMTDLQFTNLRVKLSEDYFEGLLANVRTKFPYWTMAARADQIGANHIIAFTGGRNMGLLYEKVQRLLTNVIQLAFTGIRQDLLPPNAPSPYGYRTLTITYRHGYDVVIPQFTPLSLNGSSFPNLDMMLKNKKRLFYFAGALHHSTTLQSARTQLSSLWKNIREEKRYKMRTEIQGRQFDMITIINGHVKTDEYVESLHSSVFSLCPEGFLPWSPRLYESIQLRTIPLILADNIVLPFERFIDWRSFSVKLNVSNVRNITDIVTRIDEFDKYVKRKLKNAIPYLNAFRWPYSAVDDNEHAKYVFLPHEDMNGSVKNVFHYISSELRCRRLEQLYGLTANSSSVESIKAQRQACKGHPTICSCHNARRSLAFQEYV